MTQDYVNGFFTKCAEAGVPYDTACELYKFAIDDDFRKSQRAQAMNFATNNQYLGDVSQYLPSDGFGDNRMGTMIGRTFGSIFRGGHARERAERANYAKALEGAGQKWLKAQLASASTPEERMALQKRFDDYKAHLDAGLAANEHRNGLSNAERDLAMYGGTKQPEQPQQSALTPAKPKDRYEQLMNGELALPSFYRHAFDADTGEFYRTDGRTLDPNAALWNKQMQRSRQQVSDYNAQTQKQQQQPAPAAKPWDSPYKPVANPGRPEFSHW